MYRDQPPEARSSPYNADRHAWPPPDVDFPLCDHAQMAWLEQCNLLIHSYLPWPYTKKISYLGVSQWNGKEIKEMSRYLPGVVIQSLRGRSPARRPSFHHAIECTRALSEFCMYGPYKSHNDATLSYMEDALHCVPNIQRGFHTRPSRKERKGQRQCHENRTREHATGRRGNTCWNLDTVQIAARNECLVGSYEPWDRCLEGVRCWLQLSEDPLDVSLGRTDPLIRSLATVFGRETWTST